MALTTSIPLVYLIFGFLVSAVLGRYVLGSLQRYQAAKRLGGSRPATMRGGLFGIKIYQQILEARRNFQFLEWQQENFNRFGNTMESTRLGQRVVSTTEPENIKAVLATKFNDFSLGRRLEQFRPLLGEGIFTLDGQGWSHARALLRPQFAKAEISDLHAMDFHMNKVINNLIPKDGSAFDCQEIFFRYTLDVATEFLFGESMGSLDNEGSNHNLSDKNLLNEGGTPSKELFATAFNLSQEWMSDRVAAQGWSFLASNKEAQKATDIVHRIIDYYVNLALDSRKEKSGKDLEAGDESKKQHYVFLHALAEDTQDPIEIRNNLINILLAGRDTTAGLLSSACYFLARDPRVWARLRREVLDNFGDVKNPTGEVTREKLQGCSYLKHFLNEVLRLYPAVPGNGRYAIRDTVLPTGGGPDGKAPVFVAKGDLVTYSVYSMHRRKDIWGEDAEEFRPERWVERGANRGWEYLPFNGGPRICIGQQFALTEASFVLVKLLQHYERIENADPDPRPTQITLTLTLLHARGVPIRLHPVA